MLRFFFSGLNIFSLSKGFQFLIVKKKLHIYNYSFLDMVLLAFYLFKIVILSMEHVRSASYGGDFAASVLGWGFTMFTKQGWKLSINRGKAF